MTEQAARPAPEIHVTDIVLPNQTNNENQYDTTPLPAGSDFVKNRMNRKGLHMTIIWLCARRSL
jgi:hypothetical protein